MLQLGLHDTETSRLLEVLQLYLTAVHQWQAIATQERHMTLEQRINLEQRSFRKDDSCGRHEV